ncbi:hypothetical protein JVT61DRAFT_13974 [Boletus reticuloceps]|uniref:Uncharacterized protein n=1 Tax=Boletus reticuloceps TaxID=495285 RepID=A0A8I3AAM6_9AGAM|nr:hypothetical protein JVT61DRAFT_13974 [Boletus reticuloceps]
MRWVSVLPRLRAFDAYSRYAQTAVLPRKRAFGLVPLVVLHRIFVRSRLPPPHTLHGWQEAEYVRWVDEHAPEDILLPIGRCAEHSGETGSTRVTSMLISRVVNRDVLFSFVSGKDAV